MDEEKVTRSTARYLEAQGGPESGVLHLAEEILELLTKQMTVAAIRCSYDLRYILANQRYADLVQRPLDEIVGHALVDASEWKVHSAKQ